jgi:exopolysaccharide biosynthesis polyprenyl glycosylphosphotransferase
MYRIFSLHISMWSLILLAGDFFSYWLAVLGGVYINPNLASGHLEFVFRNCFYFMLIWLIYMTIFYIVDLYDYQHNYRKLYYIAAVTLSASFGTSLIIIFFFFSNVVFIDRTQFIIQSVLLAGLMVLWRITFSFTALPQRLKRRVLIVGAGGAGRSLLTAIRRRPKSGLDAVAFVDDDPQKIGTMIDGLPVLGDSSQLPELFLKNKVDWIVVAITHDRAYKLVHNLTTWNSCKVLDMPRLYEFLAGKIPIEHISDAWVLFYTLQTSKLYFRHFKRVSDLLLSILCLMFLCPLFAMIAAAIKLDSRGPILYHQKRVGQGEEVFRIIKFRTMMTNAESLGPQWTSDQDPRITRVGRILRKFHLDELPQLINILKGEMSFVGPRPERPVFVQVFQELVPDMRLANQPGDVPGGLVQCGVREKVPYYSFRHLVKPGMTGWAQVMYPYASSLEETVEKLKYDLYYIKNMGLLLDLSIYLKTMRIVLFGRGK